MKKLFKVYVVTGDMEILHYEGEPTVVPPRSEPDSFYDGAGKPPLKWEVYQPEKGGVSLLNEEGKSVACLAWVEVEWSEDWNPSQNFYLADYNWHADGTTVYAVLPNPHNMVGDMNCLLFSDQVTATATAAAIKFCRSRLKESIKEKFMEAAGDVVSGIFRQC